MKNMGSSSKWLALVLAILVSGCGVAGIDPVAKITASDRSEEPPTAHDGQVTVNPKQRIGPIDPKLFGMHTPAWNETLIEKGVIHPRFLQNARQAGFGFLVYPGGNYGYNFVWNDQNLPTEMDTDQFLDISRRLKAVPKISLNPNKSPELAADWVRY